MLRSSLLSAEQGQLPSGVTFRGRPTSSRVINAVAVQSLRHAADLASGLIAEHRPRLAEGERVAQQIIAAARSRGLIIDRACSESNTQYLKALRASLAAAGDLEAAAVHLEGLVGPSDALILLDRALTPQRDITPPGGPAPPG